MLCLLAPRHAGVWWAAGGLLELCAEGQSMGPSRVDILWRPFCVVQISSAQAELEQLAAARSQAEAEASEAEAAAQQALEAGHAEVMAMRQR